MSVIFIVDNSASVNLYKDAYLNCINAILAHLKKCTNPNVTVSFQTFNTSLRAIFLHTSLDNIPEITYDILRPENYSAIYDCLISSLGQFDVFFRNTNRTQPPLVIILTDGMDNRSKCAKKSLALQIALCKAKNWQFVFYGPETLGRELGCNIAVKYSTTSFDKLPSIAIEAIDTYMRGYALPEVDIDISELVKQIDSMTL